MGIGSSRFWGSIQRSNISCHLHFQMYYYYMNKLNTQVLGLKSLINKQHKKKLHIDYRINTKALVRMKGLKTYDLASNWEILYMDLIN